MNKPPVLIGIDGEFGLIGSTSAQAILQGVQVAIDEINQSGGVLRGRPLQVITKDNSSIPARGIRNLKEFAQMTDLVAVLGGRFSPVLIEELKTIAENKVPLLAPWSSADPIVDNGMTPNYVFRLSLRDSLAIPAMLAEAKHRGIKRVGLLLTNTGWGRSNKAAADGYFQKNSTPELASTVWFNWKDDVLKDKYESLVRSGSQAIILVGNDDEAALLVKEIASLPQDKRVPIFSHWGITGGKFFEAAKNDLHVVDLSVIQTFSFSRADPQMLQQVMATVNARYGPTKPQQIASVVGFAHAYDLTHILAKAINLAGSTDRRKIRDSLEAVRQVKGLVRFYPQPFTSSRHEALTANELFMARYGDDGVLVPVSH